EASSGVDSGRGAVDVMSAGPVSALLADDETDQAKDQRNEQAGAQNEEQRTHGTGLPFSAEHEAEEGRLGPHRGSGDGVEGDDREDRRATGHARSETREVVALLDIDRHRTGASGGGRGGRSTGERRGGGQAADRT